MIWFELMNWFVMLIPFPWISITVNHRKEIRSKNSQELFDFLINRSIEIRWTETSNDSAFAIVRQNTLNHWGKYTINKINMAPQQTSRCWWNKQQPISWLVVTSRKGIKIIISIARICYSTQAIAITFPHISPTLTFGLTNFRKINEL